MNWDDHIGLDKLQELFEAEHRRQIDRIIFQPHWRPALTVLAVAIRRVIRTNWSAPCN